MSHNDGNKKCMGFESKIERIKKKYGSESNQYIIIALTEITSILRDYFNVDEIENDGPGGV